MYQADSKQVASLGRIPYFFLPTLIPMQTILLAILSLKNEHLGLQVVSNVTYNWVIVSEVLDVIKKKEKKASFSNWILRRLTIRLIGISFNLSCVGWGLGKKWIKRITRCVSIVPVLVLVNGSSSPRFIMENYMVCFS